MNEKLVEILNSLRAEIENLEMDEKDSKARLEKLVADIERRMDRPDDLDQHTNLIEDVKDSVTYFEVSHPTVTGILNDIMMSLSNMGI